MTPSRIDFLRRRPPMRAAASLLLILVAACAAGEKPAAPSAPSSTVDALIGEAMCDSDAQCRTVPIGAKACGGPAGYRAWSIRGTDAAMLQSAADREMQAARATVEKSGILSNCAIATDPGAYCAAPASGISAAGGQASVARQCRLRPASSGGASKIY